MHLRWCVWGAGTAGSAYDALDGMEAALQAKGRSFVFDDRRGYLTTCPSNLGTGMRASVLLRIPLLGQMPSFTDYVQELGLEVRCCSGDCWLRWRIHLFCGLLDAP